METCKDTRPVQLNSFLANGGILYTGIGNRSFYDNQAERFVYVKEGHRMTFRTLEEMSCFISFYGCDIGVAQRNDARFEWFVCTLDEVFAVFPRKRDALKYCFRISEDARLTRAVTKVEHGIYEYCGPRSTKGTHYIVGLRQSLEKQGFSQIIERWDVKQAVLKAQQEEHQRIS